MADRLLIARNPDPDSSLPYLVRIPLGRGIVLRARDTWPRTAKIYCHRHGDPWPEDADVVEDLPLRSCVQRGAAIDIVLDRSREARSQFVITRARGREMIFWQSARTNKAARPNIALPTARAAGIAALEVVVDSHERYAWKFTHQQVTTTRRALPVGDYGVEHDGILVGVVERKSLADLATSITTGRLRATLTELAGMPHAAVVVEDRYSAVFKLEHVRPSLVADLVAECQVRFPTIPIIFAETRPLAQEWTYRFLGAALVEHTEGRAAAERWDELSEGES